MARDETARERDPEQALLDRRSYLRLAGAATASIAVAGASGSADAAGHETITVPAGETRSIEVGSGETFENVLVDMTAEGASAQVTTSGDDWTIRNVAFEGNHPGGHYLLNPAVSSEDAEGLVENVYMGDGQTEGSSKGGIWVQGDHRGTITFRNVNLQQFVDNGLYGTDPGYEHNDGGHGGVVHVEDSYFNSNNIANIRVGSLDGRTCHVRNCVVEVDDAPALSDGAVNSRGVWAWWGPVEVHDSDIEGSAREHTQRAGDPSITSHNTRWGSDANTDRRPEGVPTAPEEAVR